MKYEYRVLPDKGVILHGCLEDEKSSVSLLNYLRERQGIGLITYNIRKGVKKLLRKRNVPSFVREKYYKTLEFLEFKYIDPFQQKIYFNEALNFFRNLSGSVTQQVNSKLISPLDVPSRYYRVVEEIIIDQAKKDQTQFPLPKLIFELPRRDDAGILADAIFLSKKYQDCKLILTSLDRHFTDDVVSKAILERFKINCNTPTVTLEKIQKT